MEKKELRRIPDAELDIMLVLWKRARPMKIIEIFEDMQQIRPCTKTTIHSLLERLCDAGFVKIDFSEDRRAYKIITPLVSEEEYRAAESENFVNRLCRGRWQTLMASLMDSGAIGEEDLAEMEAILKHKKGD